MVCGLASLSQDPEMLTIKIVLLIQLSHGAPLDQPALFFFKFFS